jgi:hypothetical protein
LLVSHHIPKTPKSKIRNQQVGGSNPPIGSIENESPPRLEGILFFYKNVYFVNLGGKKVAGDISGG